jgi:hypothetical protein
MTTKQQLLDFDNLAFITMYEGTDTEKVIAQLKFGDFMISVIANSGDGHGLYGHVDDNEYEVLMTFKDATIPLAVCGDVLAGQSPTQISRHMRDAQLNGFAWVDLLRKIKANNDKELGLD